MREKPEEKVEEKTRENEFVFQPSLFPRFISFPRLVLGTAHVGNTISFSLQRKNFGALSLFLSHIVSYRYLPVLLAIWLSVVPMGLRKKK